MSEDNSPDHVDAAPADANLDSAIPKSSAKKKKPIISLPFAIIAVVVLGVGAFYGQDIMAWVMLQQEAAKANVGPIEPEEYAGLSELAKSLQAGDVEDPAAAFGMAGSVPPEGSGAGGGRPRRERPASEEEDEQGASEAAAEESAEEATEETAAETEQSQPAGGGRPSPEDRFKQADANGDGLLSGDEIPARMKERLDMIDTDGDGSVSKDELMEAMQKMSGGRRGGGESQGQ